MTSPPAPPPIPPAPPPPGSHRSAQAALAAVLVLALGLLAYRGYGPRWDARPTDLVTARYDLNRADRAELEQIPGVGPKLARAIDDHRREKGPFRTVEDLRAVTGVGPVILDKVRPYLRVEGNLDETASPSEADPPLLVRPQPTARTTAPEKGAGPKAVPRAAAGRKIQPGDRPINVNTATVEELQRLPGVGPATAQHIAAARADRPFRSLADLDRVKGIGPKMLDKLRPFVVME